MKKLLPLTLTLPLLLAACNNSEVITNPDKQGPTLEFTGQQAGNTVTLDAAASDESGVQQVDFYKNGQLIFSDFKAPYETNIAISEQDNGDMSFTAVAIDATGNTSEEKLTLNIFVEKPSIYKGVWQYGLFKDGKLVDAGHVYLNDEQKEADQVIVNGTYESALGTLNGYAELFDGVSDGEEILALKLHSDLNPESHVTIYAFDADAKIAPLPNGPQAFLGFAGEYNEQDDLLNTYEFLMTKMSDDVTKKPDPDDLQQLNKLRQFNPAPLNVEKLSHLPSHQ